MGPRGYKPQKKQYLNDGQDWFVSPRRTPLAINSIVGRLNRYLSNNSLSVMVSKGLLPSLYTLGLGIIAFLSLLRLLLIILDSILDFE